MKTHNKILNTVLVLVLFAAVLSISGCFKSVQEGPATSGDVNVSVDASNASSLGSLEIQLAYDPSVLKAVSVTKGSVAKNATIDSSVDQSGKVWVGMVDANGMKGNGSLMEISFQSMGSGEGTTPLILEKVRANNSASLADIAVQTTDGSFTTQGKSVTNPVIKFLP